MSDDHETQWLVACLCAAWCGTCRDYRAGFEALAARHPGSRFHWIDIEDDAEVLGDIEVENFPTLFIQRGELVLFLGPMLPQHGLLQRTLETLAAMSEDEAYAYAQGTPERRAWQMHAGMRTALRQRLESNAG